ncbi:MAG: hypothetical protein ACFFD1_02030, partial [Candidatus Thorarchaeota archaeon]
LKPGDSVYLLSYLYQNSPEITLYRLKVSGTFTTGYIEMDEQLAYIGKETGDKIFGHELPYNLSVKLDDYKTASKTYNINDTETFWALDLSKDGSNFSEAYYQVNATLVANSTYAYVFIESAYASSYKSAGENLASNFDAIYQKEVPFFGIPSDVDHNGKIILLVIDIVGNSQVAGFFSALNWFPVSSNPNNQDHYSNYADLVYININYVGSSGLPTVAHEFQHLIQFSTDSEEDVWLDEGLSMYAEKYTGYGSTIWQYIQNVGVGFGYNIDLSMTYWDYDNIAHYGASYLFLLYLSDRFGTGIISNISNDQNEQGLDSINTSLQQIDPSLTVEDVFTDWAISLTINDPSIPNYSFINYTSKVRIPNSWDFNLLDQYHQSVDHWASDIIDISSNSFGEYWLTFRGEKSVWSYHDSFHDQDFSYNHQYIVSLLQLNINTNTWNIQKFNDTDSIPITINSSYTNSYLIVSSTTGSSSGYNPANQPKTYFSQYNLFIQKRISTLPTIGRQVINKSATEIFVPIPRLENNSYWSPPILTQTYMNIHKATDGQIIYSVSGLYWNTTGEYFYYTLPNNLIPSGDYFFSVTLDFNSQSVTLYSPNWSEIDPTVTTFITSVSTNSSSSTQSSTDSSNVPGYQLIMTLLFLLPMIEIRRRNKKR